MSGHPRDEARELAEEYCLIAKPTSDVHTLASSLLASLAREEAERGRADRAEAALEDLLIHIPNGTVLDRYKHAAYAVLSAREPVKERREA